MKSTTRLAVFGVCILFVAAAISAHPHSTKSVHHNNRERTDAREKRPPRPFKPDSPAERAKLSTLTVNTSIGDWRNMGPSNFGGKVYAIAVDPFNPSNVYVATEVGGLWGTHDAGQSWIPMFNGFQDIAFSSVKTHPAVSGMVAAG